jgi:hypothetical protein
VLLWLLALEAGNYRLQNFSNLSLQCLNLIIHKLKFSSQLVCKINEKIRHWSSNWCWSEEGCNGRLCMSWGGTSSSKSWDLWKFWTYDFKNNFQKDPSIRYCAGSCWIIYSWKCLTYIYPKITPQRNISSC